MDCRSYRVYALLGDGETQEGQVWEAAMLSSHYKLDNLVAIVDHNGLQIDGPVNEVMCPGPIADRWRAFGWSVQEIDGHDLGQILGALEKARQINGQPSLIVANTVKGKGVSFMENQVGWHGTAPNQEQVKQALAELEVTLSVR
jgi:transketolase